MPNPWDAELDIDESRAAALIAAEFPDLVPVDAVRLGSGWDNFAFLVNGEYVFRFVRRAFAVQFFENELRILSGLGDLPLPIPKPLFLGQPSGDYPWPFAGYRLLPGRTACSAALTDAERAACAPALGEFLRALHAISIDRAQGWGAGPDTIRRLDLDYRTERLRGDIVKIREQGRLAPPSNWEAIVDAVKHPSDLRRLVHGDLYVRHLIVDRFRAMSPSEPHIPHSTFHISGIIDWGDSHIGHPAIDLAIAHSFLTPYSHAEFRAAYGPISEEDWNLARWRALQHTSMLALFAHDVDDLDLLRECGWAFACLEA